MSAASFETKSMGKQIIHEIHSREYLSVTTFFLENKDTHLPNISLY